MPFYYSREGRQFGPYTEEQLLALLTQGQLQSHELVWADGMPSWAPAHTVFKTVPPPPPPAGAYPPTSPVAPYGPIPVYVTNASAKQRGAYVVLGVFLGTLGIHNFYAGYAGRAAAQLLITILIGWLIVPWIAVAIWNLIEVIVVTKDARGVPFA